MLKVGIVGAGAMGGVHADAYGRIPGVKVAGIVDVRPDAAETLALRSGTRGYTAWETWMNEEQPDVIDICLPTPMHRDAAITAASVYGKHVICEKPLAGSLEAAGEMIEACDKAGVLLLVGQVLRFFPDYAKAKSLVDEGAVGTPGTIRTQRLSSCPLGSEGWYRDMNLSGGILLDLLIHDFDWMRWTFGEVERVYAKSLLARGAGVYDHALVSLRFASGAIGHAVGSWAYPEGFRTQLEVAGDKGILSMNSDEEKTNRVLLHRQASGETPNVQIPESPLYSSPYEDELRHFVSCITDKRTPIVTGADAFEALRISLAAIESAYSGKAVTLQARGSV
ncbi:Gfo/Idh/MocA family protein [Paenibacillus solisilvae]|uniref:Gfo/Idh/MocA family protein n=1 Tax=Paenibacillus solisilvae TaxID=2486751 RepID=A0ABW0VU03_9BACL